MNVSNDAQAIPSTGTPPPTLVSLGSDSSAASTTSTSSHINYENTLLNDDDDEEFFDERDYVDEAYFMQDSTAKPIERDNLLRRNIKAINAARRLSNTSVDVGSTTTNGSLFNGFTDPNEVPPHHHHHFIQLECVQRLLRRMRLVHVCG
jgi:hypothetical protein